MTPGTWSPTPAPDRRAHPFDIAVSVVLLIALLGGSAVVWILTAFGFSMATDSCHGQCHEEWIGPAFLIEWGGIAVGILLGVGGVIYGAVRRRMMLVWPFLGIIVVAVATLIAFAMVNHAIGQ